MAEQPHPTLSMKEKGKGKGKGRTIRKKDYDIEEIKAQYNEYQRKYQREYRKKKQSFKGIFNVKNSMALPPEVSNVIRTKFQEQVKRIGDDFGVEVSFSDKRPMEQQNGNFEV